VKIVPANRKLPGIRGSSRSRLGTAGCRETPGKECSTSRICSGLRRDRTGNM